MDRLAELVSGASKTRRSNGDDFVDRLSSRYTVVVLVLFAVLVTMNQYVRNPITCWAPVHFTDAHTKFTTNYCWVKNTYYLPWDNELPLQEDVNLRQMVPYYQWIPFILLGQAALFYMPSLFWHALNSKSGVDSDNILLTVHTIAKVESGDTRDDLLLLMTNLIDRFLVNRRGNRTEEADCRCSPRSIATTLCNRIFSRRSGIYLLTLFLVSKICYIANAFGQLFMLNYVLGTTYSTFGYDLIRDAIAKDDWTEESYVAFPRVTLCDFTIRGQDLGNAQKYTVQCVLPINLYNEKIYLFLWFWIFVVALFSVVSFGVWVIRALYTKDQIKFVRNHLLVGRQIEWYGDVEIQLVNQFTLTYLRQDGALLLRLIAHNTNNVTTTEVICTLWNHWKDHVKKCDEERDEGPNSETLVLRKRVE